MEKKRSFHEYALTNGNQEHFSDVLVGTKSSFSHFNFCLPLKIRQKRLNEQANFYKRRKMMMMGELADEISFLHLVPQPVWESIFTCLNNEKEKDDSKLQSLFSLRLTCKLFRNIISKFWQQVLPFNYLEIYFIKCLRFQFYPQSIYVIPSLQNHKVQTFHFLPVCVKELKFDSELKIKDEDLKYLPPYLEKLDLEECANISSEGLKYLPATLRYLNIYQCKKIKLAALKELPLHIKLLYSHKKEYRSLLMEVIHHNDVPLVQHFINKNVDLNEMDSSCSPLFAACKKGFGSIIKALITNGAKINQGSTDGATPLFVASQEGNLDLVKYLIANGANVNQSTKSDGLTPLYIACKKGYFEIVKLLLTNKANVNQGTINHGYTPLHIASENLYFDIVKELILNGADLNQGTSNNKISPLYVVSKKGHLEMVKFLISYGANPNQGSISGYTPLYIASQEGRLNVVKTLLKSGANINQATIDKGLTSLFVASQEGHLNIVKELLANGANPNVICLRDYEVLQFSTVEDPVDEDFRYSFTPLYTAWWNNKKDVLSALKFSSDIQLNIGLAKQNNHPNALKFFESLL